MNNTPKTENIQKLLFEYIDKKYAEFNAKLIPNIDKSTVLGVRTPILRKLAKQLCGTREAAEFLTVLPHKYYEENNLHAFLIEQIRDIDELFLYLDAFLPYVDNWATCDCMRPVIFAKHKKELRVKIPEWLNSEHTYTIRYGIGMLLSHFLDSDFQKSDLEAVAEIQSDEYYVNMMRAWYFATALAKQYDDTIMLLENSRLDVPTHNKTIQKAIESYRITDDKKSYLRTLKR